MALASHWTLLGGLVGSALLAFGMVELLTAGRLWLSDVDDAASVTSGERVELVGTAEPLDGHVTSTLTETECLLCRYEIEECFGDFNPWWKTADSGTAGVPFRLRDDSGSVVVDPDGAKFALPPNVDYVVRGDETTADRSPDSIRNTNNDRHYVERRLHEEPAHVVGTARTGSVAASDVGSGEVVVGAPDVGGNSYVGRWLRRLVGSPFVITDGGESNAVRRRMRSARWPLVIGTGLVVVVLYGQPVM